MKTAAFANRVIIAHGAVDHGQIGTHRIGVTAAATAGVSDWGIRVCRVVFYAAVGDIQAAHILNPSCVSGEIIADNSVFNL
jgi:hypothetical protein